MMNWNTLVLIKSEDELKDYVFDDVMKEYTEFKTTDNNYEWIDANEANKVELMSEICCGSIRDYKDAKEAYNKLQWAIKEVYLIEDYPDMYI